MFNFLRYGPDRIDDLCVDSRAMVVFCSHGVSTRQNLRSNSYSVVKQGHNAMVSYLDVVVGIVYNSDLHTVIRRGSLLKGCIKLYA